MQMFTTFCLFLDKMTVHMFLRQTCRRRFTFFFFFLVPPSFYFLAHHSESIEFLNIFQSTDILLTKNAIEMSLNMKYNILGDSLTLNVLQTTKHFYNETDCNLGNKF